MYASILYGRALRNISAGEECTISYVELAGTRQDRRRQLLRNYHFDIDDGVQVSTAWCGISCSCCSSSFMIAVLVTFKHGGHICHLLWALN